MPALSPHQRLALHIRDCRRNLADFAGFVHGWSVPDHQQRICAAIERVEATPDARLVITMPPRHGKSETVTVAGSAWCLARGHYGLGPIERVAIVGYGQELAEGFSASVRDLFADASGPCRLVWPDCRMASSASVRWHFGGVPPSRPSCIAVGVGGPFTGRGADLILIDDPIKNSAEAHSEANRESQWAWWNTVARTRLQPGGRVVVIMTRWHEDDLAGRLLAMGGWEHLHLPALDDEGQALWPASYPASYLEKLRDDEPRSFAALYQGTPTAAGGDVWQRDWFDETRYDVAPWCRLTVTAWDTAYETSKAADYTAWCRVGLTDMGHLFVLDAGRRKLEFPALVRAINDGAAGSEPDEVALVERAASGRSAIQVLRKDCQRMVVGLSVEADKAARARAVTPLAEAGRVHLPERAPWAELLLGELTSFPNGRHDDMHDAFVHALAYLRTKIGLAAAEDVAVTA